LIDGPKQSPTGLPKPATTTKPVERRSRKGKGEEEKEESSTILSSRPDSQKQYPKIIEDRVSVEGIVGFGKPGTKPPHPNQIITRSNFKWAANSCWADAALTALFKVPGSEFERVIRTATFVNYTRELQQSAEKKINCSPDEAKNLHQFILSDINTIQTAAERIICMSRAAWMSCVSEPTQYLGGLKNIDDFMESLFRFYNFSNQVYRYTFGFGDHLRSREIDVKGQDIPNILIIGVNTYVSLIQGTNYNFEAIDNKTLTVTNNSGKRVEFLLTSAILYSGSHYNALVRDPHNDNLWLFDGLGTVKNFGPIAANIDKVRKGVSNFKPYLFIYYPKDTYQPKNPVPTPYFGQIQQLKGMGYTETFQELVEVLEKTKGDISEAIDQLASTKQPFEKDEELIQKLKPNKPKIQKQIYFVCTFNLAYSVMANTLSGSERPQVQNCKKKYPKFEGWSNEKKEVSQCSANAAKLLSSYDIFGLQEVHPSYAGAFFREINKHAKNRKFIPYVNNLKKGLMIIADEKVFGKGEELSPSGYTVGPKNIARGLQVVWFNKHKLLFVNLHAPHNINLKYYIELALNSLKLSVNPERVIMTGDFNDYRGKLIKESIDVFNLKIRNPGQPPRSCCTDSNYKYFGDYILDSLQHEKDTFYYGLPLSYERNNPPMSDHDPVVLIPKSSQSQTKKQAYGYGGTIHQVGGQKSVIAKTLDFLQNVMQVGVESGSGLLGDASKLAGQFWQNVTQGMDVASADTVKEASKNLDLVCEKNEQIINMFNKLPMETRRILNKKMDLTMFNKVHKLCKEKGSVLSQLENVTKMNEFTKKRDEAIRLITKFQSGLKPEAAEKAAQGLLSFLPVIYEKETK
jgi:hypothetical protein